MAREYAKVKLTIWNDPDFRKLSADAQWLYFTMLTHPTINSCGVMEWREAKLVRIADDMTIPRLKHAAWELGQAGLAAVDPETEEGLVRSFVRHDGVLQSPNMTRALVREHAAIASLKIMALVYREVRRGLDEHPEWKGAEAAEPVRKQFPEATWNPFEMVPDWFQNGSRLVPTEIPPSGGEPFENGSPLPLALNPQPSPTERGASRKRAAHPLPDSWKPNASHIEKAMAKGLDVNALAERMRNWAEASDKRYVNWDATFRNWIEREDARPTRPEATKSPWDRWDS